MGFWETLALFNIIKLMGIVMPEGLACVIVLFVWLGFFALFCLTFVQWALTKELIRINAQARVTMEDIYVLVYPSGATKEKLLKRNAKSVTEHMEGGDHTWTISDEGFMTKSNGVRFTYLHPEIGHNVSLNQLVKFYLGTEIETEDGQGQKHIVTIRNIIRSAQAQDRDIYELAMAQVEDLQDPNKKLTNAAIAIALIIAVCGGLGIIFILMPKPVAQAAVDTTATTLTIVTSTTLPQLSRIVAP